METNGNLLTQALYIGAFALDGTLSGLCASSIVSHLRQHA